MNEAVVVLIVKADDKDLEKILRAEPALIPVSDEGEARDDSSETEVVTPND